MMSILLTKMFITTHHTVLNQPKAWVDFSVVHQHQHQHQLLAT